MEKTILIYIKVTTLEKSLDLESYEIFKASKKVSNSFIFSSFS